MKNWLLFVFGPLLAIDTCARVGHGSFTVSMTVASSRARVERECVCVFEKELSSLVAV